MTKRAVFFDVGETLVYAHPSPAEIMSAICAEAGVQLTVAQLEAAERAVAPRVLERQRQGPLYSISAENSQRFWTWVYEQILDELAVPPRRHRELANRFHRQFNTLETWQLYPDAMPALEAVAERRRAGGLSVGVLSNWEDWLETLLTQLELSGFFDFVVVSASAQLEKPDPAIFRLALERAGVSASQALHVGDSLHADVYGALHAGIRPVLLDRRGRYAADQVPEGAAKITTLMELPPLLE
jgi:putative hydrolase of the HAD superfamily